VRTQLELKQARDRLMERNRSLEAEIARRNAAEENVRALNAGLEQHARKLEQSNRDLESFSYTVSHDLRAPLRAINGFAHILRESEAERLSSEGRDLFERVIVNTRKMSQLIDDVLAYSRTSRAAMARRPVDLNLLVAGVLDDLRAAYGQADIQVDVLPTVRADTTMMRQVYANLIGNALKFSAGRDQPQIRIGVSENAGESVLYVRDNGAGFDMTYADKLFGMFQRLHSESEFAGTGAGLSIVKRLVERHDGRIWAEAVVDQGATFYFTLGR
jgi:light-regulated signal transduction histidine kinase (bacteriophytochrome)